MLGNDLATLPDFPAEIRAPAGTLPGVSAFQLHFADHDIMTPGDSPNVLVAMNPAALKANLPDLPRGGDLIVNTDEFTKRNLARVGYDGEPSRGRRPRRLSGACHPPHLDDGRGAQGRRRDPQGRRAGQEHVRARPAVLAVPPPDRGDRRLPEEEVRQQARAAPCQHHRLRGRLELRRDHRGLLGLLRDQAGPGTTRPLPQHQRQPGHGVRAAGRFVAVIAAAVPRARTRSPRRRTSCTSSASTSGSACGPSRPRTRSPASVPHLARRSADTSA